MKKSIVALAVLFAASSTVAVAQDVAGGANAKEGTIGGVATTTIAAGVVGVAVAAAVISNNRGTSIDPVDPVDPPTTGTTTATTTGN